MPPQKSGTQTIKQTSGWFTIKLLMGTVLLFIFITAVSKYVYTPPSTPKVIDNWFLLHTFEVFGFIAFLLAIFHSIISNGKEETLIFFAPCLLYSLLLELPFTTYNQNAWVKVGPYGTIGVVIVGWCVINYITLSILRNNQYLDSTLSILQKGIVCGLLAVSLDIMADPIANAYGLWTWGNEFFGTRCLSLFGVPVINFMNWFYTVLLFTSFQEFIRQKIRWNLKKKLILSLTAIPALVLLVFILMKATLFALYHLT